MREVFTLLAQASDTTIKWNSHNSSGTHAIGKHSNRYEHSTAPKKSPKHPVLHASEQDGIPAGCLILRRRHSHEARPPAQSGTRAQDGHGLLQTHRLAAINEQSNRSGHNVQYKRDVQTHALLAAHKVAIDIAEHPENQSQYSKVIAHRYNDQGPSKGRRAPKGLQ